MDIKSLNYFLTVAKEGNITKAAKKLFMAQPPLSRQIMRLEEELGVLLFVRGKRHMTLTEEGRFLQEQAQAILELINRTQSEITRLSGKFDGLVSIGATEGCSAGVLCEILEIFHKKYPAVKFNIWCGNGDEIKDKLERGLTDIGIVREPFNTELYEKISLRSEPWTAVMSVSHPLATKKDEIKAASLKGAPLFIPARKALQDAISDWFENMNIFCTYNTIACILPLLENNVGIAICPDAVKNIVNEQKLVCKKITDPEHWSNLMLIKGRHKIMSAATQLFWNFTKENIDIVTK